MEYEEYWFEKQEDRVHPIAVHWKGRVLEFIPLAISALFGAILAVKWIQGLPISTFVLSTVFAFFSAAQGVKYYFYHEKTKSK